MNSLHSSRAPAANRGYHGPQGMAERMRQVGGQASIQARAARAAAEEQGRMDRIRAQRDRAANARKVRTAGRKSTARTARAAR